MSPRSRSDRPAWVLGVSPCLIGVLVLCAVPHRDLAVERAPRDESRSGRVDREDARALFESYCYGCHADGIRKGGLELDRLLDSKDRGAGRPEWEKVWKTVRHEFMPPAHADRPTDSERRTITRWIEGEVFGVDEAHPDPGRVTIRRLNRIEYNSTVRDLFGVDLDLARELPPDDTAYGFDNIGDVQTLSPALLETYLNLAEKIVANVIVEGSPPPPRIELRPGQLKPRGSAGPSPRVEQVAEVDLIHAGRYTVESQFRLGGFRAFGGEYAFQMTLGGQTVVKQEVSDGGEKTYTLSGEVTLPSGKAELALITEPVKPAADGKLKPLTLVPRVIITGPIGAGISEYPEPHRRVFFQGPPPEEAVAKRAYARAILGRIADRAFRRPAGEATLDRLVEIALAGKTFEGGIAQAVSAILSSPRFYYRAELQPHPDDPKEVRPIDDYALASRLSFLLWLSIPDDELTALAASGKLRDDVGGQVRRMLADPKSSRFFEDFAGQWLRTRNILLAPVSITQTERIAPLRGPMKRETEMLFEHIARNDRDLIELLTADYSFLNERLATYYGIEGVKGDEIRRVALPADSHRGGILTHGSLLISTSNPNRTSPVKRGVFVLENLLGREVPPPPPNVGNLEDARKEGQAPKTLRAQLALHREKAACASCHNHFDPIGLAMENYSNLGRWREKEAGEDVDPRTTLVTGESISGVAELSRSLATRKEPFYRCVTEKLLTYALGRGLEPTDAVTVDRIVAKLSADGGKFSTLLAGVTESAPFLMRRGDSGQVQSPKRAARLEPPPPDKRKGPVRKKAANRQQPPAAADARPTAPTPAPATKHERGEKP
jgi:hypothetical protein